MAAARVRPAGLADVPAIAAIHVRAWQAAYRGILPDEVLARLSAEERARKWTERLRAAERRVLVAEAGGDVLGWLTDGPSRDPDAAAATWEIYGIYVRPDRWRQGVGQQLMAESRRHARTSGRRRCTLWAFAANRAAREFYESVGFRLDRNAAKDWERDGVRRPLVRYALEVA